MNKRNSRLAIIGAGRVGTAMACLAKERGYRIIGLCCLHFEKAKIAAVFLNQSGAAYEAPGPWLKDADITLITTPDGEIGRVCGQIAAKGYFRQGSVVAHCSGAHPSSILVTASDAGCHTGSIHPLQSCATQELAIKAIPSSYFCIEGSEYARDELKGLALAIGGRILEIATADKPLYHAGAAVASNFLVAVINFALTLYENIGIDRQKGVQALAPLFEGTINNIKSVGIPEALTGPIMRGDLETVEAHLAALKEKMPGYIGLYCALGHETVKVALAKGTINQEIGRRIHGLFFDLKDASEKGC
ncbi:DUF2520 domain-containing protein [bacterium]|nr:DUF2520 domain-containing protein [bacterium]